MGPENRVLGWGGPWLLVQQGPPKSASKGGQPAPGVRWRWGWELGEQARVVGCWEICFSEVSEVRCSQEPTWQRGGRICDRAEGLEVPLSRVPWL